MSQNYFEDQIIVLPQIEDGVHNLGDLWNCRDSRALTSQVGYNIMKHTELSQGHVRVSPIQKTYYNFTSVASVVDRMQNYYLDGNTKLDILTGLLNLKGSLQYGDDESKSTPKNVFACQYLLENSFVELILPVDNAVINQEVFDKLENGEMEATHVVVGVVIGAELTATISVNSGTEDNSDGAVVADIAKQIREILNGETATEVQVNWKQNGRENETNVNIIVASEPMPKSCARPHNIAELFNLINILSDEITKEQHWTKVSDLTVIGVPIRFMLLPILQVAKVKVKTVVRELDTNLMEKLKEIVVSCIDMQQPGYIKKKLTLFEPMLTLLLSKTTTQYSKQITEYEQHLQNFGKIYLRKASDTFSQYKKGNSTDIITIIEEFEESDAEAYNIFSKVEQYICEGMKDMQGAHYDFETSSVKIISTETELEDWNCKNSVKVCLEIKDGLAQGVVQSYFNISKALSSLGIEMAIVMSRLSSKLSLTITISDVQNIYKSTDIKNVSNIVAVIVGNKNNTRNTFYTIYAGIHDIHLPLKKDQIHKFGKLIELLLAKNCITYFTDSLLKLKVIIQKFSQSSKWVFVVPLDAEDTALEAVENWLSMKEDDKYKEVVWIFLRTGMFNMHEAPLLVAFNKYKIRFICLDKFDITILKCMTKSKWDADSDLPVLSPTQLHCTFRPEREMYALTMLKLFDPDLNISGDRLAFASFIPDQSVCYVLSVVQAALRRRIMYMVSVISNFILNLIPDLVITYIQHGWEDKYKRFDENFQQQDLGNLTRQIDDEINRTDAKATYNSKLVKLHLEALKHCSANSMSHADDEIATNNIINIYINYLKECNTLKNAQWYQEIELRAK